MSRGSYQRRVYITILQHNDGYLWQDKYMRTFTGDDPGFFMRKMIEAKKGCSRRTKIARSKPTYCRRKVAQCHEEELDYGEEAVAAAEDLPNELFDLSTLISKYEVNSYSHIFSLCTFNSNTKNNWLFRVIISTAWKIYNLCPLTSFINFFYLLKAVGYNQGTIGYHYSNNGNGRNSYGSDPH